MSQDVTEDTTMVLDEQTNSEKLASVSGCEPVYPKNIMYNPFAEPRDAIGQEDDTVVAKHEYSESSNNSEEDTSCEDQQTASVDKSRCAMKIISIPMNQIVEWEDRLRKSSSKESIAGLASTIKQHGLSHAITVKKTEEGNYKVIVGHRRYLAYRYLKLPSIPAQVVNGNSIAISLIENIQRENLTELQRAEGLLRLKTEYRYKRNTDIAKLAGLADNTVSEILSLNEFPDAIKNIIREDKRYALRRLKKIVKLPANKMWEEFLKYQDELDISRCQEGAITNAPRMKRTPEEMFTDESIRAAKIQGARKLFELFKNHADIVERERQHLAFICHDLLIMLGHTEEAEKLDPEKMLSRA